MPHEQVRAQEMYMRVIGRINAVVYMWNNRVIAINVGDWSCGSVFVSIYLIIHLDIPSLKIQPGW